MVRQGDTTFQDEAVVLPLRVVGTLSRDMTAASGNVAYTGIGFRPSYILFLAGVTATAAISIGFDDNINTERHLANLHEQTPDTWQVGGSSCINVRTASSAVQIAVISSFDSDGFTLTWTKFNSPPAGTLTAQFTVFK